MFPLCAKLLEDKLDQRWHERTFLGRQGYKIVVVDYVSSAILFRGNVQGYFCCNGYNTEESVMTFP